MVGGPPFLDTWTRPFYLISIIYIVQINPMNLSICVISEFESQTQRREEKPLETEKMWHLPLPQLPLETRDSKSK